MLSSRQNAELFELNIGNSQYQLFIEQFQYSGVPSPVTLMSLQMVTHFPLSTQPLEIFTT